MSTAGLELGRLGGIRARAYAIRFAAGAATSLAAALVGDFVASRAAGPFLAFPAIYIAGLTLVEREEGEKPARNVARGAIAGGFALAVFAIVVDFLSAAISWPLTLLAALAAWLVVAFALDFGARALFPHGADAAD